MEWFSRNISPTLSSQTFPSQLSAKLQHPGNFGIQSPLRSKTSMISPAGHLAAGHPGYAAFWCYEKGMGDMVIPPTIIYHYDSV